MAGPSELRVGHDERSRLVSILQTAAAEGRLTGEELAERTTRVADARTYADLDALVADLPLPPPSQTLLPGVAVEDLRLGWSANDPLRLSAGMSSEKRTGRWEVPPYLHIHGDMGSVVVNCLQAICSVETVHVEVSGGVGSIKIIVPDGWGVNTDRVIKGWGSVRNRAEPVAAPGQPQLVLRGSAGMGSLTVRTASRRERRKLAKEAPSQAALPAGEATWVERNRQLPNPEDLR